MYLLNKKNNRKRKNEREISKYCWIKNKFNDFNYLKPLLFLKECELSCFKVKPKNRELET